MASVFRNFTLKKTMTEVFVLIFLASFEVLFTRSFAALHFSHMINKGTYEEGKRQFELMKHQAELPRYGQCWKDAMVLTQTGCERLNDDVQGRLALAYLNCFLHLQGRQKYECSQDETLEECTKVMEDSDRSSFTIFFTHTQNVCYFLRAQVWNEATENTISVLAESSSHVASQLHESSQLQAEIIKQQNDSLKNQKILMENYANLTNVLSSSSEEINRLFQTFKETTQEQRLLITDVFDQLISLKQMVVGEFSGFYTILYYFFSILVCYLLTSTTRTSGARFWLFCIVTMSIFCEYFITALVSSYLLVWSAVDFTEHDDWVYWIRNCCRKLFAGMGLLVLGLFAYNYHDINTANNQLLVEIRKQNSDLKRLLCGITGTQLLSPERRPNVFAMGSTSGNDERAAEASSWDSQSETHSMDSDSDRTYILQETEPSVSESDSYTTAKTLRGNVVPLTGMSRNESLMQELQDLRCATPLKEMFGQIENWTSTGVYMEQKASVSVPVAGAAASMGASFRGSPYTLRPRQRKLTDSASPATKVESPHSFAKTVHQLERIAKKNSRMVCAVVAAKNNK